MRFSRRQIEAAVVQWRYGEWPTSQVIIDVGGDEEPNESTLTRVEGTDLWVRGHQRYVIVGGDLPYVLTIEVAFDGAAFRCVEARFAAREGGDQVSSTGIRRVPLDRIERAAIASARTFIQTAEGRFEVAFGTTSTYKRSVHAHEATRRRRTSYSDLAEVARIYREALATGEPPTAAVERGMRLANRNTAKKWVQRARAAGLLDPAPGPRKAGVASPRTSRRPATGLDHQP